MTSFEAHALEWSNLSLDVHGKSRKVVDGAGGSEWTPIWSNLGQAIDKGRV